MESWDLSNSEKQHIWNLVLHLQCSTTVHKTCTRWPPLCWRHTRLVPGPVVRFAALAANLVPGPVVRFAALAANLVPGPVVRFAALAANLGPAPATILARGHIRRRVRHQQLMHFTWRFMTLFKWCHWWHRHYKSCAELWKASAKIYVNVVLWSPLVTDLNPF